MPHSKELIDRIAALLAIDYPHSLGYRYVFEKKLQAKALGRRCVMPDVRIDFDGATVCAVEIGYTRPEKLTLYRETLRIPDVRWYGKDGTLHADVQKTVVSVSVAAEPSGSIYSYCVWGLVRCIDCPDLGAVDAPRPVPERCEERYIRRFGQRAYDERLEKACEGESQEVFTHILTDYVALWLPTQCDKCGRAWMAGEEDEGCFLVDSFRDATPRALASEFGPREVVTWAEARQVVTDYGYSLNYMDGHFIDEDHRRSIHVQTREAR